MSRQSTFGQQRTLSLTEELEKLEQSITLTLQEIDHNFSRAHRIVTSSILPIVEQYGSHSRDVWEGSKFWKQFFESSANVSLSGYEEQPSTLEKQDETITEDSNATTHTTLEESSHSYDTPSAQHISTDSIQDIDLSDLTISPAHSTPRPTVKTTKSKAEPTATFADYPSPYEDLRREVNVTSNPTTFHRSLAPETPGRPSATANQSAGIAMTPESSPFLPANPTSMSRPSTTRKKTDPLLHRMLDRNYRVKETPLKATRYTNLPSKDTTNHSVQQTPATANRTRTQQLLADDSLLSSPEPAAPDLNAEIFSSPHRRPMRTPGVSVLPPTAAFKGKAKTPTVATAGVWDDSDDDIEDDLDAFGQSPPKTMQFHVPQRRLLKTPAKEASKRIVEDLLLTAGLGQENDEDFTDDIDVGPMGLEDDSPSVVRRAPGFEDDTF